MRKLFSVQTDTHCSINEPISRSVKLRRRIGRAVLEQLRAGGELPLWQSILSISPTLLGLPGTSTTNHPIEMESK